MNNPSEPIRMLFEMTREEHPRLYDDLIRFPKGTKRINRLRTLAHDGLLLQMGLGQMDSKRDGTVPGQDGRDMGASALLTNQIFQEPLID